MRNTQINMQVCKLEIDRLHVREEEEEERGANRQQRKRLWLATRHLLHLCMNVCIL